MLQRCTLAALLLHGAVAAARPERVALFPSHPGGNASLDSSAINAARQLQPSTTWLDAATVLGLALDDEARQAMVACNDADCAADLGGALGVDEVLLLNEGGEGGTWSLSIMRVEVRHARLLGQTTQSGEPTAAVAAALKEVMATPLPTSDAEVHFVTHDSEQAFQVNMAGNPPQRCAVTAAAPCVLYVPPVTSNVQLSAAGYPARGMDLPPSNSGITTYDVHTAGNVPLFIASVFGAFAGTGMVLGGSVDAARGIQPPNPTISISLGAVVLAGAIYGLVTMYPQVETSQETPVAAQ